MNEPSGFSPACPAPVGARDIVEIGHGGGGRLMHRLIDDVFRPAFASGPLDFTHDGATLEFGRNVGHLAFTTDSYVVRPLFFPGGDIGSLAVNGTVNDLAMCGAEPCYLSAGFVIEEGFGMDELRRIVESMRNAAARAGVRIVTGDTKVVERGKGDGLYINTSGVGVIRSRTPIAPRHVQPGDAVIVCGDIGRHGIAVLAVREGLEFETAITSDCAPLADSVRSLIAAGIEIHCMRDLTRGGLATALIEIAEAANLLIELDETAIPISDAVRGACEILGLDPLYVANEGRFVALVPAAHTESALACLRCFSRDAAVIGRVERARQPDVRLHTIGGARNLDMLSGEQLPRIC
ncbi:MULTISPECIES: hydrogenase expression/formation protein HypE [Burkholderia]|uniref:hydrogenase expression/formation protein HypE n=1 Tax=Burkholderia TaxID=32008 RepID=UPI0007525665|nr:MULTISPECIES: hydrogenase expression/formation protein HypE [Burkholderia]AOJ73406.1 hydrogenase expression/formation protein HypE [Burkholderia savannae]KVG48255.1 hydrogenase expression/formation protein HypE [Burkholderia sp. MSMB0265]KVG84332.1 hydrogenase expression/formation protein HypE [Burkholderia sp. MSMB2040]KVG92168.1 hydrogenase expression/formation protein HypE [Burkholderia sp. MSMB2042]KVG93909.1 hydrogenase expression/formation protein HypE [Burkholderia sp. MSMB2041]